VLVFPAKENGKGKISSGSIAPKGGFDKSQNKWRRVFLTPASLLGS
jgi:hypothetical protein